MGLFINNPKPWIFVFVSLITFATSVIFGSLSIFFTSTVVILSSTFVMFIFFKKKQKLMKNKQASNGGSYQIYDHDNLVRSPDVLSENECLDQLSTKEDYSDDGSISDEDSLIEIALPASHYVGHELEVEEPNFSMQQKLPDFMPESFFRRTTTPIELLAELNEMNEEENLIEIDISMGSIKCSRFEIEA